MRRQGVERMQVDRGDDHQQRPAEHLQPHRNHGGNQPQGSRQHDDAEEILDAVHPRSGFGQERTGEGSHQQQGQAHAERHDEQRGTAQYRIAGLRDVKQGSGQRCGDTGTDDQRRERAHQRDGRQRAALAVGGVRYPALQCRRHLQFIEAEHRQREHDEDQRKAAQHPGILQRGGEQRAGESRGNPHRGVCDGHAQHIG